MTTPYLSVVIPAFNEELRITDTLSVIYEYLQKQDYEWEVLVVIDGAQDGTLARTQEFAAGRQHIRYIDRKQNRGKGYTVREGTVSYTHLRAHETPEHLVCRLLLEKKKK